MTDRAQQGDRAQTRGQEQQGDRAGHVLTLTLDERDLILLEGLLTTGRSRPLARRMGRDRETLKRWQDGLRFKLKLAIRRAAREGQKKPPTE